MRVITKCKVCKSNFIMTQDEALWFLKKGFKLPRSCKECRKKRIN